MRHEPTVRAPAPAPGRTARSRLAARSAPGRTARSGPGVSVAGLPAAVIALLTPALLLLPGPARAQDDMQDVEVSATHVAGSVWMLEGRGGNIGVSAGEDGVVLVDDQFAPLAPKIRSAVEALDGGDVRFVLNTHWHGDHTGGNEVFGREATVISHENVRKRLSTVQVVRGDTVRPKPEVAWPVVTFDRSVKLHVNGDTLHVRHYPAGHTDGDAVVFFRGSNVVHMGDLMFAGGFPFVDLGSGGTVRGYMEAVATILDEVPADAAVIPGHGPLTDVEGLRAFHDMLVETVGIVEERREEGMTLEEAKAAGLPDRWSSWGEGFISTEDWIETVYRSPGG